MYSRKSSGYTPYTPPPNYNGVAFTRDFKPYLDIPESPVKEEEKEDQTTLSEPEAADALPAGEFTPPIDTPESVTIYEESDADRAEPVKEEREEVASIINGKEMRIEDLLIIGAVILFVSGEFDGDLMLLLGLLLIAGI